MYNFKYDIKFDDETGRPYIHLPENYATEPEHKFMAMEMVAYQLHDLAARYSEGDRKIGELFMKDLLNSARFVGELSDQLAKIIKEQDDNLNQMKDILKPDDGDNNEDKTDD